MSATVSERSRPKHGELSTAGPKRKVDHLGLPPWHGWSRTGSEWRDIVRWIESTLVVPVGIGGLEPMTVAPFQQTMLKRLCDAFMTFISIPAGNGKTTLMAAVGLERVARGDEYVEVDVLATKEDQARRLVQTMIHMVECSPALADRFDFFKDDGILKYIPTGSWVRAHPTKLSAIQGLNGNLTLIDEIGMVPPEIVTAMVARLDKRQEQRVVGFGTPGFDQDNMLESLRKMAHARELPPGTEFIEYAADPGCDIMDEEQWRKANPAMVAGFLGSASMPLKAAIMPEHEFRMYHLGQPVESSGPWLPQGAWADCMISQPPPDGAVFFGWQAEKPSDDELGDVLRKASEQWELLEVTYKPHIRLSLMSQLGDEGLPVEPWPGQDAGTEARADVESTAALYQAIAEGSIAHDGDEVLAEQVGRLTAKVDRQGNPRLVESSDADVSVALAARAAWWRARCMAEAEVGAELVIY